MFKVININQKKEWDDAINAFNEKDIYIDRSYYASLSKYLKCKIYLLYYEKDTAKICEVVQVNDIADNVHFTGILEKSKYFDIETPYGYGGLTTLNSTMCEINEYYNIKCDWAKSIGVISEFIRFNPLSDNAKLAGKTTKIINIKSTIFIELKKEEDLFLELNSKNRNMVRKAQKNNITIEVVDPANNSTDIDDFIELYIKTMQRNNAEDFYYFNKKYFIQFFKDMRGKSKIFNAKYQGKTIASAIIIFNNKNIHYYLSGADRDYMNLAPNNLLLYNVGVWAYNQGFEKFHLGGGVSDNDALFGFKKQFNEKGILPFYIGRVIYDEKKFDYLVELRQKNDENFDLEKTFLIKYRQE